MGHVMGLITRMPAPAAYSSPARAFGIRPANGTAYSLTDLQDALAAGFGAVPYIGCSGPRYNTTEAGRGSSDAGYTIVSEVWYYHHVYGAVQRQKALRVDADIVGGRLTNCAQAPGALHYLERSPGSEA